jgi:hypothetical protein
MAGTTVVACSLFADLGGFDTEATTADAAGAEGSATTGDGGNGPVTDGAGDASSPDDASPVDGEAGAPDPYAEEVKKDSPLAWFRFEETTGPDAKDEMGGAPGQYASAGISYGVAGVRGTRAVRLDGTSGRISFGKRFGFQAKAPHSIEIWYTAEVIDNVRYVWSFRSSTTKNHSAGFFFHDVQSLYERYTPPGGSTYCSAPSPMANVRYHAVVTLGSTARLYVDGSITDQDANIDDLTTPSDAEFVVGDYTVGQANKLRGMVDELVIYDKELTDVRVKAHYDAATK